MTIDLNWRPRLVGMNRLVPQAPIVSLTAETLEGRRKTPSFTPAATFESRQGYQDDFLGGFVVPWPKPAGQRAEDVYPIPSAADNRLDYTHFSLIMSRSRRMAMFVGVNISGSESVSIDRQDDKWFFDGRLPIEAQLGDDLYADNLLDRGHLVRREDPNWGGTPRLPTKIPSTSPIVRRRWPVSIRKRG
ncbi:DNA/RNA non-specific endonuclease [Cupriavidus sp. L7L]|uniref:DNA/RNA non-specific endonuclease n=1 Tax=Cupriavidus sp. L7L TaxID=2546443 RepID=UPI001A9CCEDA|nr:DNA/RNA non-specific endonuclease [Cupriavidus sp. L7L]